MYLILRRRQILLGLSAAAALLVFSVIASQREAAPAFSRAGGAGTVLIIDPGHGGEDGGAVAPDGTSESGINLAVALRLRDLFSFCGKETRMTRTEDVSIYSDGAATLHQKKVSDLKNRVALVNGCPGALLISIHQNNMPSAPSVHGAQVFFNDLGGAPEIAAAMQTALNGVVNGGREKTARQIPSSIYLMKHAAAPAVLVECGFLSNRTELEALQTPARQIRLALAVAGGYYTAEVRTK